MAKLEWNRTTMGEWQSKPIGQTWWRIWVNDDGEFVCGMYTFPNLGAAKEHCEKLQAEKKDAAAPAELPKPGEVWGVAGKPETRRFVCRASKGEEIYFTAIDGSLQWHTADSWQSWVRESGAVRIDDQGQAVHWSLRDRAQTAERRVKELEAKVARLREQLGGEPRPGGGRCATATVADGEWAWLVRFEKATGTQSMSDFAAHQIAECVRGLFKERDDLRKRNSILERRFADYRDCLDIAGAIAASVENYDSDCLLEVISPHIEPLIAERDDAQAAVARLLAALRGIRGHDYNKCDHEDYDGCFGLIIEMADKAIKREEEGVTT